MERPNKAAIGAFNMAMASGASEAASAKAASNAVENSASKSSEKSSKNSISYGAQPNGSFVASSSKQFGSKVEAMAGEKNPGSVILKGRDGNIQTKVEKSGPLYVVTKYDANGKPRRIDKITKKDFEYNYRHHI